MGNPGANHSSLDTLHKTLHSLKEIRSALLPFLRVIKDDIGKHHRHHVSPSNGKGGVYSDGNDATKNQSTSKLNPHRRAEAQAAVALAVCTLRYMGGRLRGLDVGRRKDDPLRMELDKIRGILVSLKKMESSDADDAIRDNGGGGVDNSLNERKDTDGEKNNKLNAREWIGSSEKRKLENEVTSTDDDDVREKSSSSNKKQRR